MLTLTDQNFKEQTSAGVTLVDFWADWCGPCHVLSPTVEELAKDLNGKAKVGKLDVDANQQTAMGFGVMSIPTVIIFKDGKESGRLVGVQPKDKYIEAVEQLLG